MFLSGNEMFWKIRWEDSPTAIKSDPGDCSTKNGLNCENGRRTPRCCMKCHLSFHFCNCRGCGHNAGDGVL